MNFIKNRFLFIMVISGITLTLLIVGALTLYKDNSSSFNSDGYILETTTKTNSKYYFNANTKYKENVDKKIAFEDTKSKKVAVEPTSFIHYSNGNIAFLKKGALVNLSELTNSMVSYYNITPQNVITSEHDSYTVSSNGKKINIESFVGRISDNKYIIAGNNLALKVPKVDERISGDYFEVVFIEEGIIKIDNEKVSYQVTAQDSYIYVDDNIAISFGDGKIYYNNEAKMLLSQITINNDENIDLDVEKDNSKESGGGGGSGSGDGTGNGEGAGEGQGEDGTTTGNENKENGTGDGTNGDGTGDGTGNGENGTGSENGNGNGNGNGNATTASPQIELIDAKITTTTMDLTLQLNNATLAKGDIIYYLIDTATGEKSDNSRNKIEPTNGTFRISKESLLPSTEYVLTIGELDTNNGNQYFQKTFKTKDLGINLEKVYATDSSLSYKINFDENTDVTRAKLKIYDNNGEDEDIEVSEEIITKDSLDGTVVFEHLKPNTSYSAIIETVWINNTAYSRYPISRIDTTLKRKPELSGIKVDANGEEIKFTIQLENVEDYDNGIINYTYNVYKADDITLENLNPEPVYTVTKADNDPLVLNLNSIDELKTGVDYRAKIIAQYDDNEMIRESSTDYSNNFLIKSKPNIAFEQTSATMNKITGVLSLIDANCSVPVSGRNCFNRMNNFTLRYYKIKESETTANDKIIGFDSAKLTTGITLTDLSSNSTYVMKLFGDYYDDNNQVHTNVQIGDAQYFTTDKTDNIHFEVVGDNISGKNKDGTPNSSNVVNFDARLTAPQDSTIMEEISTITLNLYSGRYNNKEKLIGTYTMTSREEIEDFFSNLTITNNLFTDTTNFEVGKLNSLTKLIKVTNNATNSLNSDYTVEIEDVYDSGAVNKLKVEDNIYTFHLTSSYYLDTRIETNPLGTYVTVTPITKKNLTPAEYQRLSETITNLDDLNDDTIVGITLENSLSDMFVDSAFTYEKVTVEYTMFNLATEKMAKTVEEDMGNKYQPKTQTIYLDPSELDDESHFTRGYKYKIGYNLKFITEDGENPVYTNDKLHKVLPIERQSPIYTQYISSSNNTTITYKYTMKDIDGALADNSFYYRLSETGDYTELASTLAANNQENNLTIPINDRSYYELAYARKNTNNQKDYVKITNYEFEKEYLYNNEISFHIINDNDNTLKLKLENNDITSRAIAYRVNIKAKDNQVSDYSIYFLSSKLNTIDVDTGEYDEEGEKIIDKYKYISIDYANISKFMKHEMEITVLAYYDSGLVGLHQDFSKGLIIKSDTKYLNTYNGDINFRSYSSIENEPMGLYLQKEPYSDSEKILSIYNQLIGTSTYNPIKGANFYNYTSGNIPEQIGINYKVSATNAGLVLKNGNSEYTGYNAKVLKEANLKTENNTALFNTIIPTIKVTTANTINSLKINMVPTGVYGTSQFVKDGAEHKKVYVTFYKDQEKTQRIETLTSNVNITESGAGYEATIDTLEYNNLTPDTAYYFTVFAYIDGNYTQLYSGNVGGVYKTETYVGKTLSAKDIITSIKFHVEPTKYNGENSEKTLTWRLGLKNTENYKLRFEFYEKNGTTTTIDPETSEEIQVPTYKEIKFDGTTANSCNKESFGTNNTGYISNCYISVDKDKISTVNNNDQKYYFTNSDFTFGDDNYKLVVYAIPYTNDTYKEDQKITLYENGGLHTTGIITENGLTQNIKIPTLEPVTFDLRNTLDAGFESANGYFIDFVPTINDPHYVMKYGKYTITLQDEKGNVVNNCKAFIKDTSHNENEALNLSPCRITLDNEINAKIKIADLASNTRYYLNLNYQTYRNNVGMTEEEKVAVVPFTDFIYTPIASNITLGTVTAGLVNNKSVALTYNGSANLTRNIVEVAYTITEKGASNKVSGVYSLDNGITEIFTMVSVGLPRFTIDVSDESISSNTAFKFQTGNTYIITTQYYYLNESNQKVILEDQETHNTNFTAILNL